MKALCRLFGHKWDEWKKESFPGDESLLAVGLISLQRQCLRCGHQEGELYNQDSLGCLLGHRWSKWKPSGIVRNRALEEEPIASEEERECLRCGRIEWRTVSAYEYAH